MDLYDVSCHSLPATHWLLLRRERDIEQRVVEITEKRADKQRGDDGFGGEVGVVGKVFGVGRGKGWAEVEKGRILTLCNPSSLKTVFRLLSGYGLLPQNVTGLDLGLY